jgi:hypothetical protein
MPDRVADQPDGGDDDAGHGKGVPQRDSQEEVQLGLGLPPLEEQVRVPRHHPDRGRGEAGVERGVPRREEAAERTILEVDVVPAVEEEAEDQRRPAQCGDEVLPPEREWPPARRSGVHYSRYDIREVTTASASFAYSWALSIAIAA